VGDTDAAQVGEVQGGLLPRHDVPFVGGVRELRDEQPLPVSNRCLGARPAERAGPGIEEHLDRGHVVAVAVAVAGDDIGGAQQAR
jgi:hypothetical protein